MKYKGAIIYANAKQYSRWTIDENGKLNYLEHEYEGDDFEEYQAEIIEKEDSQTIVIVESAKTLDECKKEIDQWIINNPEITILD